MGKRYMLAGAMVLWVAGQAFAAALPCEELKGKIEKQLQDKGVAAFTLTVVPVAQDAEGKQVGTCDGGKNKIMYSKEKAAKPMAEKKAAEKPAK